MKIYGAFLSFYLDQRILTALHENLHAFLHISH
jgi:hypothetical protein